MRCREEGERAGDLRGSGQASSETGEDEVSDEDQRREKVGEHGGVLQEIFVRVPKVADAGDAIKDCGEERDGWEKSGLGHGENAEGPHREICDTQFPHDGQGIVRGEPEYFFSGEAGLKQLAQTSHKKPDAGDPKDKPFAHQVNERDGGVKNEMIQADGSERQDRKKQNEGEDIHGTQEYSRKGRRVERQAAEAGRGEPDGGRRQNGSEGARVAYTATAVESRERPEELRRVQEAR